MVLFVPTRNLLLRHPDSYNLLMKYFWPLFVWIVVFIMTLFMLFKGLKRVDYSAEWGQALWISSCAGVAVAIIAWLICVKSGRLEKYVQSKVEEDEKWEKERAKIYAKYSVDANVNGAVNHNTESGTTGANNIVEEAGNPPLPNDDDDVDENNLHKVRATAMKVPQKSFEISSDYVSDVFGNTNSNKDDKIHEGKV